MPTITDIIEAGTYSQPPSKENCIHGASSYYSLVKSKLDLSKRVLTKVGPNPLKEKYHSLHNILDFFGDCIQKTNFGETSDEADHFFGNVIGYISYFGELIDTTLQPNKKFDPTICILLTSYTNLLINLATLLNANNNHIHPNVLAKINITNLYLIQKLTSFIESQPEISSKIEFNYLRNFTRSVGKLIFAAFNQTANARLHNEAHDLIGDMLHTFLPSIHAPNRTKQLQCTLYRRATNRGLFADNTVTDRFKFLNVSSCLKNSTRVTTEIPMAWETELSTNFALPDTTNTTLPLTSKSTNITSLTPYIPETMEAINPSPRFLFIDKLLVALGLGAFTGFLNGASQVILHIAEQKKCSIATRRLLTTVLTIANSFSISTLPLVYSIIKNFNEENDPLVNSTTLLTCCYAFMTSLALQGISQGAHYLLPKKSILKNIINFLPLSANLWMVFNNEENAIDTLAVLGINLLTATGVSATIQFAGRKAYTHFFDITRPINCPTQPASSLEMQPFTNTNNDIKKTAALHRKSYGPYITTENLQEIKQLSTAFANQITEFQVSLKSSKANDQIQLQGTTPIIAKAYEQSISAKSKILATVEEQLKAVKALNSLLNEDIHQEACKKHTDKHEYIETMEKLGNVFKFLESTCNQMHKQLNAAYGFVQAAKESFDAGTGNKLHEIIQNIDFLLSKAKIYVSKYNTAAAADKAEEQGVKKAVAFFTSSTDGTSTIARRANKTRSFEPNRRHSITSDYRINSSGSGQSDSSGHSANDPLTEQQVTPLLKV